MEHPPAAKENEGGQAATLTSALRGKSRRALPQETHPNATRRSTRANRGQRTAIPYAKEYQSVKAKQATIDDRDDVSEPLVEEVAGELFGFSAMFEHREQPELMACSATSDPDTMYYHQAMREPDSADFVEAVKKEFGAMLENNIFHFIERSKVPKIMTPFPAVWAMKRKRRVKTREIYKWKARLNLDAPSK